MNIKLESQYIGWFAYDADCYDVAEELRWQEFDAQLQEDRHNARR